MLYIALIFSVLINGATIITTCKFFNAMCKLEQENRNLQNELDNLIEWQDMNDCSYNVIEHMLDDE